MNSMKQLSQLGQAKREMKSLDRILDRMAKDGVEQDDSFRMCISEAKQRAWGRYDMLKAGMEPIVMPQRNALGRFLKKQEEQAA